MAKSRYLPVTRRLVQSDRFRLSSSGFELYCCSPQFNRTCFESGQYRPPDAVPPELGNNEHPFELAHGSLETPQSSTADCPTLDSCHEERDLIVSQIFSVEALDWNSRISPKEIVIQLSDEAYRFITIRRYRFDG